MANAIARSEGKRVVAVVGLAHVDGIVANVLRQQGRPGMRPSVCPVEA
jgi:pheromone shutdown protein TraB